MKVKINKEGKVKEFKLINKWEDVTIETYSKLMTFTNGTKSSEALETLTELSNIPKELLKSIRVKAYSLDVRETITLAKSRRYYFKKTL
jgi:hypothetical protein